MRQRDCVLVDTFIRTELKLRTVISLPLFRIFIIQFIVTNICGFFGEANKRVKRENVTCWYITLILKLRRHVSSKTEQILFGEFECLCGTDFVDE